MMIEKLSYSETMYPDRVEKLCYILEEKLDHVTLEYVKELAEVCYKEGYKNCHYSNRIRRRISQKSVQ